MKSQNTTTPSSPAALARWTLDRLKQEGDPAFQAGQQRFFQHEVRTFGWRSPQLHRLAAEVYLALKKWPLEQRNDYAERMWNVPQLEGGGVAIYVYRRFTKQCGEPEFRLFERWLDRYVNNWAHTDGLASWLMAACIGNEPRLMNELAGWTESPNRWRRRAAAVSLLQEAKKGRSTEVIFDIATRLLPQRDDMVEKGIGWLLKETYPKKPKQTVAFLQEHGPVATRLTLRYAAEKMSARDRRRVLSKPATAAAVQERAQTPDRPSRPHRAD